MTDNNYQICEQSDVFKERVISGVTPKSKYPWKTLNIGKVFIVPFDSVTYGGMMSLAYAAGKRLNKKFKVVIHNDKRVYEVGRLPDPVAKAAEGKPAVNPAYLERTSYGTRMRDDNGDYTKEFQEESKKLRAMSAEERAAYDASFGIKSGVSATGYVNSNQVKAEWAKPVDSNGWPTTWSAQLIEEGE